MRDDSQGKQVADAMRQINAAWLEGRIEHLAALVHPDIVMVFPGFAGRAVGRDALLAGFRDFSENATIQAFHERDTQVDLVGTTGVVSFSYDMVYERAAKRYRATGRDLWVFAKDEQAWLAVWRAMLDVQEHDA